MYLFNRNFFCWICIGIEVSGLEEILVVLVVECYVVLLVGGDIYIYM
jgi:hypothetical protein